MSTYGLEVRTAANKVIIDGERSNYYRAETINTGQAQHDVTQLYQTPIVFIRPNNVGQYVSAMWVSAPTGQDKMTYYSANAVYQNPHRPFTSQIFRPFKHRPPVSDNYGLEIKNSQGQLVIDANSRMLHIKDSLWYSGGLGSSEITLADPNNNLGIAVTAVRAYYEMFIENGFFDIPVGYGIRVNGNNTISIKSCRGDNDGTVHNTNPIHILTAYMT